MNHLLMEPQKEETKKSGFGSILGLLTNRNKGQLVNLGDAKFYFDKIRIRNYPFKPSTAYTNCIIKASSIKSIVINSYPPMIRVDNDLIFISRENVDNLELFATANHIPIVQPLSNWSKIIETKIIAKRSNIDSINLAKDLEKIGISENELNYFSSEIEAELFRFFAKSPLWYWRTMGLLEVLTAMNSKYGGVEFELFYKRAVQIEMNWD